MPKIAKRLSDKVVENAAPRESDYKLYDGEGLCLLVRKTGRKVWQYPYTLNNKRTVYTIGSYLGKGVPGHISLLDARQARHEARVLITQGIAPSGQKKREAIEDTVDNTFADLAREWHQKGTWVPKHAQNILRSLEDDVFSFIGQKPIASVSRHDIIQVLKRVEERGALDVAKRLCQRCEAIFDYGIAKGVCDDNPASGRAKYIQPPVRAHRPHLKEKDLGEFLIRLNSYHGKDYIRLAMRFLALTFVRPGELRHARWSEIDMSNALWCIPAAKMKMKRDHSVPLSRQALEILEELKPITGNSDYLFPGVHSPHKPISDVTLLKVIQLLGYVGERKVVPHGFRHTASTILNEHRHDSDVIERQLAHVEENKIRGVYNHAEYLPERRALMQWYSDHLDDLTKTTDVGIILRG